MKKLPQNIKPNQFCYFTGTKKPKKWSFSSFFGPWDIEQLSFFYFFERWKKFLCAPNLGAPN